MGNLIYTVGGTDNLVNFKSAARVPIDSLKVHFSPIQEGEGDPSPENVRPISGWDGIEQFYSGKNVAHIIGFSTSTTIYPGYKRYLSNSYGTTINTLDFIGPDTPLIVTQELQETDYYNTSIYKNGYFIVEIDNLSFNHSYIISFKISNILSNSFNRSISDIRIANPNGNSYPPINVKENRVYFQYIHKQNTSAPQRQCITIYNCGMSFTMSEFMIVDINEANQEYEPYTQKRLVNWNQWLPPLIAENWQAYNSNNINVTFEDGIATSTWLTNNSGYSASVRTKVGILQKSKEIWYVSYMVKSSMNGGNYGAEYNGGLQETSITNLEADKWYQCSLSNIYWKGTRNFVYISYYHSGIDEHIGLITQVKAPLFINLTQMFGPGNEPTKEEFEEQCALNGIDLTKAFPYDEGSVREWKTNGKLLKNTITFPILGKNKFNINAPFAEPSDTNPATNTLRIFQPYTYCLGLSNGNNYLPDRITNFSISNGTLTFTSINTSYGIAFMIPLLQGTYRLSYTGENVSIALIRYNNNGNATYSGSSLDANGIFAIGPEASITGIIFKSTTANTPTTVSNIQIEEGITATEYEEFNPNHTVYGGYVDLAKGELVATHRKITLTGYEDITYTVYSTSIYSASDYFFSDAINTNSQYILGLCSHTTTSSSGKISSSLRKAYNTHGIQFYSVQSFWGLSEVSVDALIAKLKEWYSNGTPLEIVYELAEPIHYSLTPHQLTTFLNQNNFWSNTNDVTEVSYAIHDSEQIRSARKRILAAAPKIEEASGSIATFNTDISASLKKCKVYFSPAQEGEGDPSPDNVRAINGWTGCEVYRAGNNLFDKGLSTDDYRLSTGGVNYAAAGYYVSAYIPVNEGQILTKNSPIADAYHHFCTYSSKSAAYFIRRVENNTITIAAGENFVRICGEVTEKDTTMLCVGNLTTLPIDWTTEAGTVYGGYVDLVKGELIQTCYNMIVDENTIINRFDDRHGVYRIVYNLPYTGADKNALMCNKFGLRIRNSAMYNYPTKGLIALGDYNTITTTLQIGAPDEEITTQEKWLNWLTVNGPIQVIYELAEPIHYSLTPTQLKTLRGTNNIWSNSNGDITVQFWRH